MAGSGPDIAYSSAGLRTGGGHAREAAGVARSAHTRLVGSTISPAMFGEVDNVADVVGAVTDGHRAWLRTALDADAGHVSLDERSRSTADLGEQLDTDTAARAATARPGPITTAMLG